MGDTGLSGFSTVSTVMLTARIGVTYEGDWTAETADQRVFGQFLAYTFEENRSFALIGLVSEHLDATIDIVRDHHTVTEVQVVDRSTSYSGRTETGVLIVKSKFREIPPLELLTYEEFFPISNPSIEDGRVRYDLVFDGREELQTAIGLLGTFGAVELEYVSEEFHYHAVPPVDAFESLVDSVGARQLDVLALAVREGYFEEPRTVTVAELGGELSVSDTAVSNHLREARLSIMEFVTPYLHYASTAEA